jgi:uncharacterized membrane protein YedE/YeeE
MLEALIDRFGDGTVLAAGGMAVGFLFGAAAQHSRFCLRAATVEFFEGKPGPRIGIWLVVFFSAVALVQTATALGLFDPYATRQISATGSVSGAVLGGLMFGAGMILARGCASRLLVLSATGNLRAFVTGLILTLVAQASLRGGLAPVREDLAGLWTVAGGAKRDLAATFGAGPETTALVFALAAMLSLGAALWLGAQRSHIAAALGVGAAVAAGWVFTFAMTQVSFEPIQPSSITFTGPSADTLMALVNERGVVLDFGLGLVPGVFLGSATMALLTREWVLQGFDGGPSMLRYFSGAALMGFGAMLAGGCAVGAGVSGGAVLAVTSWIALFSMWIGSLATQVCIKLLAGTTIRGAAI